MLFIFLFLAVMGPHCCAGLFSSCNDWGLLFAAVSGFLLAGASLVAMRSLEGARALAVGLSSCGFQALEHRLNSCGVQAETLRGMWDLPRLGIKPTSPALAGGFDFLMGGAAKSQCQEVWIQRERHIFKKLSQLVSKVYF